MPQRRLEHYFFSFKAPFSPSSCSFLHLPHTIRQLIYKIAELDRILVDLNYSNLKVYQKGTYPQTTDCRKLDRNGWYDLRKLDVAEMDEVWEINNDAENIKSYGTSLWGGVYGLHQSMLLVSKQVHQEVEAFTYAGAVFRVCLGHPLGFTRLWRMSDNALANLGSLTIRLDVPKTVVWNDGWAKSQPPSKYLDLSTKWGQTVSKDWISLLLRFSQSIRPGHLRLRVIFCAKTLKDAIAIMEPMMLLPQLKDFGICAELQGQRCWWKLQQEDQYRGAKYFETPRPTNTDTAISRLAQRVIRKLTLARERHSAPFRYLDLPQEIQLAILEYTDLVSPEAVQWRPRKRVIQTPSCTYCTHYGYNLITDEPEVTCLCHCGPGANVDDTDWYRCCRDCRPDDYSKICYCSIRGPIWASSCSCRYFLRSLFSVSRKVRQDAITIYYACNQMIVTPYNSPVIRFMDPFYIDWPVTGIPCMPKIELSLYLSSIARSALQHIRWLEWILPSSQRNYLLPGTPAWFDYLDTILMMENAMNISALTFTINIAASGRCRDEYEYDKRMLLNEDAWRWYETIILPVRRLGEAGLKDFFVHLRSFDIEEGRRIHHEQDLERAVMGREYSSSNRGKPVERAHMMLRRLAEERERVQREFEAQRVL